MEIIAIEKLQSVQANSGKKGAYLIRGFLVPVQSTDLDVYSTNKCGNNKENKGKGIEYQNLR